MRKYNIKCTYDTGDSFHTRYDEVEIVDIQVSTLELAKENLKRIKEHYEYYSKKHKFWDTRNLDLKALEKTVSGEPWFVKDYDFCLKLILDEGKEYQMSTVWCGYFEKLTSAEIVSAENGEPPNDLKVCF